MTNKLALTAAAIVLIAFSLGSTPSTSRPDPTGRSFPQTLTTAITGVSYPTGDAQTFGLSNHVYGSPYPVIINNFDPLLPYDVVVDSVDLIISLRAGTYGLRYLLKVEVRNLAGNLLRTVSTAPVNLEQIPELTWISVPIASDASRRLVGAGEYLCIRVYPGGGAGGNLDFRMQCVASVH